MGIYNLHDQRTIDNDTNVDAVFEVDCADCEAFGLPKRTQSWCAWTPDTSIYNATMRASGMRGRVTLYLYDKGAAKEAWLSWLHPDLPEQPFDPSEALKKKLIQPY